jgi:hypothetical protein
MTTNFTAIHKGLDKLLSKAKMTGIPAKSIPPSVYEGDASGFMTSKPFSQPPDPKNQALQASARANREPR